MGIGYEEVVAILAIIVILLAELLRHEIVVNVAKWFREHRGVYYSVIGIAVLLSILMIYAGYARPINQIASSFGQCSGAFGGQAAVSRAGAERQSVRAELVFGAAGIANGHDFASLILNTGSTGTEPSGASTASNLSAEREDLVILADGRVLCSRSGMYAGTWTTPPKGDEMQPRSDSNAGSNDIDLVLHLIDGRIIEFSTAGYAPYK